MNIVFPHKPQKHGGPGSFQERLEAALREKNWQIGYFGVADMPDAVMVVGGTKKLLQLQKYKRHGVPIIYRLDGINWLHKKTNVSFKRWLLGEVRNRLTQIIRAYFATNIIYQSKFVERWWNMAGWKTSASSTIIHNGVSLEEFKPKEATYEPLSILCVEGTLDYSPYAVDLLNELQEQLIEKSGYKSIILYGGFGSEESKKRLHKKIDYRGRVPRSELPNIYKNAVYLSLDVNAACPNTVIEALATGLPVIGFDTGALKELVPNGAGEVVPYGSNPWELEFPDVGVLCEAALKVHSNWSQYAKEARRAAEERYDQRDVVEKYIEVINSAVEKRGLGIVSTDFTVHYFTNIAPHYREPLWKMIAADKELKTEFYFGEPFGGIRQINFKSRFWEKHHQQLHPIKNVALSGRVLWQQGVIGRALSGNVQNTLFLGDANIISTWIAALCLKSAGKKVSFWGHGFLGDETYLKKILRKNFYRLADRHFVYSERSKKLLMQHGFPADKIFVIYNSLDYDNHKELRKKVTADESIKKTFPRPEDPLLVFIGRLTKTKKLDMLIRAVHILNSSNYYCNLLLIGDGPEKENLTDHADELLEPDQVHFYGACYDEEKIGRMLANADLCVSPGNVGLTAIHSLSFGTPVCTHNNFSNQGPEFEAIEPGETGCFFEENNIDDLANKIRNWFARDRARQDIREDCYRVIDQKYNPYHQIEIFKKGLIDNG